MNRRLVWVWCSLFLLTVWCGIGPGELQAQSRVLIQRELEEKAKQEAKPPGRVEPGPKGARDLGWGAVHQPPKGAGDRGLKAEKPQGHLSPSATRAASRNEPQTPQTPGRPKTPAVPKAVRGLPQDKPEPTGLKADFAESPDPAASAPSWVKEEHQKLMTKARELPAEEEEEFPRARKRRGEDRDDQEEDDTETPVRQR